MLKKASRWAVVHVPRKLEHEVVERSKDPSVLRPAIREGSHRKQLSFNERRRNTERFQHEAGRNGKTGRQRLRFIFIIELRGWDSTHVPLG